MDLYLSGKNNTISHLSLKCISDQLKRINRLMPLITPLLYKLKYKAMKNTVLITGASSGFGRVTAKLFNKMGWNVIATMRSPEKETELTALNDVFVSRLDVTDKLSIQNTVTAGIGKFGKIDVL